MAKNYKSVATYPSSSSPGKVYMVSVDEEGNLSCTCPAWTFKKGASRTCKHVQEYQAAPPQPVPVTIPDPVAKARAKGGSLSDLFKKLEKLEADK